MPIYKAGKENVTVSRATGTLKEFPLTKTETSATAKINHITGSRIIMVVYNELLLEQSDFLSLCVCEREGGELQHRVCFCACVNHQSSSVFVKNKNG